jgi:hypothetical protein
LDAAELAGLEAELEVDEEAGEEALAPGSLAALPDSLGFAEDSPSVDFEARPLPEAEADEARESVMYQPLPLKTMPTGWMTLRSAPPHCSQVVRGGSEKLWRFSITSLQAVQV